MHSKGNSVDKTYKKYRLPHPVADHIDSRLCVYQICLSRNRQFSVHPGNCHHHSWHTDNNIYNRTSIEQADSSRNRERAEYPLY